MKLDGILYANALQIGPEPPEEIVLIEPGVVVYTNQKPHKEVNYTLPYLQRVAANFAALGSDKVIDYEHQTLKGGEAPAGGWVGEVFVDPDRGLVAKVREWTNRAQEYLRNKEYRFISPVIDPSHIDTRTGENIGPVLHSVALTNDPLMYWLQPLVSKAAQTLKGVNDPKEEEEMDILKELAKKLGLAEDASQEEVFKKVGELLAAKGGVASLEVLQLLGAKEGATLEDLKPLIAKLKGASTPAEPDPQMYVAKGEFDKLQGKHNTLQTKLTGIEEDRAAEKATQAVDAGVLAGKLTPAQRDWALEYAKGNPEGFAAYIAKAPQVGPPMGELLGNKGPGSEVDSAKAVDEIADAVNTGKW